MRNAAVRDRITKQFRDAAAAVQALAIQEDEDTFCVRKRGLPVSGGTSGYAPRPPAGASRAAGGGTSTVPGIAPAGRGPVKSPAPVPLLPPQLHSTAGADQWPLRDFLELGALPSAVSCARLHARLVIQEWGFARPGRQHRAPCIRADDQRRARILGSRVGAFRALVAAGRS